VSVTVSCAGRKGTSRPAHEKRLLETGKELKYKRIERIVRQDGHLPRVNNEAAQAQVCLLRHIKNDPNNLLVIEVHALHFIIFVKIRQYSWISVAHITEK
jgi:hypothetical protein